MRALPIARLIVRATKESEVLEVIRASREEGRDVIDFELELASTFSAVVVPVLTPALVPLKHESTDRL